VLHRTRQPLRRWFHAAYLLSTLTPGVSALQLKRQLGIPSYGSAWSMLHRLRRAMQKPLLDRLSGAVEVDETYVGAARRGGKRGRGAPGKVLVAGAVEVRGRGSGRIRLAAIPSAAEASMGHFVRASIQPGSRVFTDGWRSYGLLDALGYVHEPEKSAAKRNPTGILPRIHRVFSNLKTWLAGTHHGVDPHYLPRYLREFEYRFNRRASPMAAFQTLLGLAGSTAPERSYHR
jgi:transposase-like protein